MRRRELLSGIGALCIPTVLSARQSRQPVSFVRTNWSRDPYSLGAYSFVAKGAKNGDRAILARPVGGRLYFAGEACNHDGGSTVHAAYSSGLSSAQRILESGVRRVSIVGAGIAGLTAASRLSVKGIEVTVFEARSRVGGRIWTDRTSIGLPADLGASWIHNAQGNPISRLADRANAALAATGSDYIARNAIGNEVSSWSIPGWVSEVLDYQNSLGAMSDQVNKMAYFFDENLSGDQLIFLEGYDTVLQTLLTGYDIKFSSPVTRIRYDTSGVWVSTDEKENECDAVLVTVPLGVLKNGNISFAPDLPVDKKNAIARLGFGLLDKCYIRFEEVFWEDTTWLITHDNGLPRGQFNHWLNLNKVLGLPVLLGLNGANSALDLADLPDDLFLERAMRSLSSAFP